jgi:hypothetical protein
VRWKACDEYLLDDVEWEPSGRRNKGPVGVDVGRKAVALLHQLLDGFLQFGNFIVQIL